MDSIDHIKMTRETVPKESFETLFVTVGQKGLTFNSAVPVLHQTLIVSISLFEDINGILQTSFGG